AGRISVGEARPAIAGLRLVLGEEGDHRCRILARPHGLFGPAPHLFGVGPVGIGNKERRRSRWTRHIAPSSTARGPAEPAPAEQHATCWTYYSPAPYQAVNAARRPLNTSGRR